MKNTDWKTVAITGLLVLVAVLVVGGQDRVALARSTDSNGSMIAVTGEYGNGTSVLYVIDTKTRNMAVYRSLNGQGVQLVAAWRIDHDLKLVSFRDNTEEGFSPLELERNYLKFRDRTESPNPLPAAPPTAEDAEKK